MGTPKQPPHRIHKICSRLLVPLAAFCTLAALIIIAVAWRLSSGPISLDLLKPTLEQVLSRSDGAFWVSIDKTYLEWDQQNDSVALRAEGARVLDDYRLLVEIPEIIVGLSARALVFGEIKPNHIDFLGPVLSFSRNKDGNIDINLEGEEDNVHYNNSQENNFFPRDFIALLEGGSEKETILSSLSRISFKNTKLVFHDDLMGKSWEGDIQSLIIQRTKDGLEANSHFSMNIEEKPFEIALLAAYSRARKEISASLTVPNIRPAWLSEFLPTVNEVSLLDVPLSGRSDIVLGDDGAIRSFRFRIDGQAGRLGHPHLMWPVTLAGLRMDGRFQPSVPVFFDDFTFNPLVWDLAAKTQLQIPTDTRPISIDLALERQAGQTVSAFSIDVDTERPSDIADRIDDIAQAFFPHSILPADVKSLIERVRLPLGLSVDGQLNLDGLPEKVQFSLIGGAGEIEHLEYWKAPILLEGFVIDGQIKKNGQEISIHPAIIDLPVGNIVLVGKLSADPAYEDLNIQAQAFLNHVPMNKVIEIWPMIQGDKSRIWVAANLSDGEIKTAQAKIDVDVIKETGLNLKDVDYSLWLEGVTARYLEGLPPLKNTKAVAFGTLEQIDFGILSSEDGRIKVKNADILITGFSNDEQDIDIDAQLSAPVRDVMLLLAQPRLGYPQKIGIKPQSTSGHTLSRLKFQFPLLNDLKFHQVSMNIENKLSNVTVKDVALGLDAKNGRLNISIDEQLLTLKGTADFAETPVNILWRENLKSHTGKYDFRSDMKVSGQFASVSRNKMGFHFLSPYLEGPVDTEMHLKTPLKGKTSVNVLMNLQNSRLHVQPLKWEKRLGQPGQAKLSFILDDGIVHDITSFRIFAAGLDVTGSAEFDPTGSDVERIRLSQFKLKKTNIRNLGIILGDSHIGFFGGEGVLDIEPFMGEDKEDDKNKGILENVDFDPELPFSLETDISLDKILLDSEHSVERVFLKLYYAKNRWSRITLKAGTSKTHSFNLDFRRFRKPYELVVYSKNFGDFFKKLGLLKYVHRGELALSASFDYKNSNRPLDGRFELRDYRLIGAPTLANVLKMASLIGIFDLLSGDGISFSTLQGRFSFVKKHLIIHSARTHSPAVGITMKGWINLEKNILELAGTVAPAYILTQIIDVLPGVREFLTGVEREGVFAATYHVKGGFDNPDVSVNPLSALAPGFLRDIFTGEDIPNPIPEGAQIPGGDVSAPPVPLHPN